jgi:maltooligosyltrehalose trehalohydrolase
LRRAVAVALEPDGGTASLQAEGGGYFSALVAAAAPGTRYRFLVDDTEGPYPDPASRFQPEGPHGPSQVVDPSTFPWSDAGWRGVALDDAVFYELHIGTFTPEGTWAAAEVHLPALAELGVTVLEVMPVADYPGRFGWGYDGVDLYAPCRLYGAPDDFRHFVDTAHRLGLAVILDVVYNHLGPDGNYLGCYSKGYVSSNYENEWGEALNFDGPDSAPVREFFVANAAYWVDEYHLDGLRLDATQQIFDASADHLVKEVAAAVRRAGGLRTTLLVGENEPQDIRMVRDYGVDALWNDDFHHSLIVAVTGRREAYYTDYLGKPQELVSAAKYGFLYQGQWYLWQDKARGSPCLGVAARHFVTFLENHDQIANSGRGDRLHREIGAGRWRAATALLLLMPGRPMLFQGQEFAASAPFLYFADHKPDLARAVRQGRTEFLAQFPRLSAPELVSQLADPSDPATFEQCRLDHGERQDNAWAVALHRDLLALRRNDTALRAPSRLDGAVLSDDAFMLRYFGPAAADDRVLLVNFGRDLPMQPAPEPLLAPPGPGGWRLLWSSEDPAYGGTGSPPPQRPGMAWGLPGRSAIVLGAG